VPILRHYRSVLPHRPIETLIGRGLAMCVHPYAAWRSRSIRGKAFVVSAYAAAGYALALGLLFLKA
jgi:hypothetical protein